jgi:hypothetical protein
MGTLPPGTIDRLQLGWSFEDEVADRLKSYGYAVTELGQRIYPQEIRTALFNMDGPCRWRWIPDLITARHHHAVLIDAKTAGSRNKQSPNHAIEYDAYLTHQRITEHLGIPVCYVFHDWTANYVHDLDVYGPYDGVGPGRSPFILVRKQDQRPFDSVFVPEPF